MQRINFSICGEERQHESELAVEERIRSFQEVEHALEEAAAVAEAKRCLGCRACIGCGLCKAICEKNAIVFEQSAEEEEILIHAVVLTPEGTTYSGAIPEKYGSGKYINLITESTFEQMTQEEGWCDGLVLRLSDGDIPKRIAVIVEPDDEKNQSLTELVAYVQQAVLLMKKKIEDSEIKLFFPGVDKKLAEYVFDAACALIGAEIVKVEELAEEENLQIAWVLEGKKETETFDLAVLFNGFAASGFTEKVVETLKDVLGEDPHPEWDIEKMTPGAVQVYLNPPGAHNDISTRQTVADEQQRDSNAA